MTDAELIAAADQAGLCFPKCWFLDGDGSPLDDLEDARQRYADDPERLADFETFIYREEHQRQENLGKLRRFAALIEEALIDEMKHTEFNSEQEFISWVQEFDAMIHSAATLSSSIRQGYLQLLCTTAQLKQGWIDAASAESQPADTKEAA